MQDVGTVQGDCNPLDRLMLWGIVTPLTLADGDYNPKASSCLAGIYTPARLYSLACLWVYDNTNNAM